MKKRVSFNDNPQVKYMIVWSFAYRQSRKGPWEQYAVDTFRFKRRISQLSVIINPVLENKIKMFSK